MATSSGASTAARPLLLVLKPLNVHEVIVRGVVTNAVFGMPSPCPPSLMCFVHDVRVRLHHNRYIPNGRYCGAFKFP